jgi:hypothetical protein
MVEDSTDAAVAFGYVAHLGGQDIQTLLEFVRDFTQ